MHTNIAICLISKHGDTKFLRNFAKFKGGEISRINIFAIAKFRIAKTRIHLKSENRFRARQGTGNKLASCQRLQTTSELSTSALIR
jgi:hypothetical protein